MLRVAQISDTHLSAGKRHFAPNWEPLRRWLAEARPDLVIHTGDLTVDGADEDDDLRHCARLMREVAPTPLVIPGNHDVGEAGGAQPVNAERLARWRRHVGPDRWAHDVPGWRLIGLNSLLCGSGDPEEDRQVAWLEETMREAGGRRLAWFLHQPLFVDGPDEPDTGYWSVKPEPRARLLALARRHRVALVGSGHLHRLRDRMVDGVRHVWGPASGFVCGPMLQPDMAGEAVLGAMIYELSPDGFSAGYREIPGLQPFVIDDVLHEVYPPRQAA